MVCGQWGLWTPQAALLRDMPEAWSVCSDAVGSPRSPPNLPRAPQLPSECPLTSLGPPVSRAAAAEPALVPAGN